MVVSLLLAALLVYAAMRKLSHRPEIVATYTRVGVPEDRLDLLAAILLAAAAGLIAGLFWEPIGVAAGIGLVVYFLVAVAAHIRYDDKSNLPVPVAMELLAIASLIL
jgi:hypothetical protein